MDEAKYERGSKIKRLRKRFPNTIKKQGPNQEVQINKTCPNQQIFVDFVQIMMSESTHLIQIVSKRTEFLVVKENRKWSRKLRTSALTNVNIS